MPPVGFEATVSACELPQTYAIVVENFKWPHTHTARVHTQARTKHARARRHAPSLAISPFIFLEEEM